MNRRLPAVMAAVMVAMIVALIALGPMLSQAKGDDLDVSSTRSLFD